MSDLSQLFLKQSMEDSEALYAQALMRTDAPAWDVLVITAANEAQANAFRAQLDLRKRQGHLPRQTQTLVLPDPNGKRVGSGGATLSVLATLAHDSEHPFRGKRVLVLHSGGDSKRIPQYSACGKLFARVPRALPCGLPSTLFDELCLSLSALPSRMPGGMLVLSGDVLLLFNALQIDLDRMDAAALSIKAPAEMGTHHGVFVRNHEGVQSFLHKQPLDVLAKHGAVNAHGQVDIDTGAIWLGEPVLEALYALIRTPEAFNEYVNDAVRLSFYGDFLYPMAAESTLASYLAQKPENQASDALDRCRHAIYEALRPFRLSLLPLSPASFIHFGTTGEWRDLLVDGVERYAYLGWKRQVVAIGAGAAAAFNTIVHQGAVIAPDACLEDCEVLDGASVGAGAIVSGATFSGRLPAHQVLHVLPIDGGRAFCARLYGVDDNPKEALRFGQPIAEPLWSSPVHPVRSTEKAAIAAALAMETTDCISLEESFARADVNAVLQAQATRTVAVQAAEITLAIQSGTPFQEIVQRFAVTDVALVARLTAIARASMPLLAMRIHALLAQATGKEEHEQQAWTILREALSAPSAKELSTLSAPCICMDRAEVALPVRVNFGGGWSDTPPYCLEYGGTVLNAGLLLGGQMPVVATVERIDRPEIVIESDDLGITRTYRNLETLHCGNPHDPHALCKAALAVTGVIPANGQGDLAPIMQQMGGGLRLRTAVHNIPKGSGLGTSSILSAAVVRALVRVLGQPDSDERIAELTLSMEQLMQTCGGWQDQIGGLAPGIKLIHANPGIPQKLTWRQIIPPAKSRTALDERFVLLYTGQRRLARDLLKEIMGKVIAGEKEALNVEKEIQRLAILQAFALETGDVDSFASLLNEHWTLSKRLDKGSTNTCIDTLIKACEDMLSGVMICGAGGGGFLYGILQSGIPKADLAHRIAVTFQDSGARLWDASLLT